MPLSLSCPTRLAREERTENERSGSHLPRSAGTGVVFSVRSSHQKVAYEINKNA